MYFLQRSPNPFSLPFILTLYQWCPIYFCIFSYLLCMDMIINLSLKPSFIYKLQSQTAFGLLEGTSDVHRAGKQRTWAHSHQRKFYLSQTPPLYFPFLWTASLSVYSPSSKSGNCLHFLMPPTPNLTKLGWLTLRSLALIPECYHTVLFWIRSHAMNWIVF